MPMESMVVVAGVLLVFSLFAVALAWVDYSTPQRGGLGGTPAE